MENVKDYLQKFKYLCIALLGITIVISVHEFGHFLACKMFKVHTPTFSIGIDPAIVSKRIGSTIFQIGALPLGGYVSINNYDFEQLPYIKKMIIVFAGIIFNLIFAAAVFLFLSIRSTERKESNQDSENAPILEFKELLKKDTRKFIGPFGIIGLIEKSASKGIEAFFYFLAIISINIALFNVLPLPFLDGGQAFSLTIKHLF